MEGISLFLWILYEKGSHESYYHANTEKRSPPGNPRRNSRLGRTIPNQPAAPATPGSPVVDLQYKKREASLLLLYGFRQRPTLPGRVQPSTIGAEGLNFCVRYGNRWYPFAIITGNCELCLCLRLLSNNTDSLAQLPKPVNSFVQKYSKNPNSERVRIDGSPGRARTYNNSVNSRVLCH